LIAGHPLQGLLATYDREIAALRSTQTVVGLDDPAARTQRAAAQLQATIASAQARARAVAANNAAADLRQENAALSQIFALRDAGDSNASAYAAELDRGTAANLSAYAASIEQRTQRAFDARRRQLHEKELTLAYDLLRADAAQRLTLRLKLGELHLTAAARSALEAQLAAIAARESRTLAAARRNDAATLESYSLELQRQGAAADERMAAQLRSKAGANLALGRQARQAESQAAGLLPDSASQLSLFRSSYRFDDDARAIAAGLSTASADLSRRFAQLARSDRSSRDDIARQIRLLQDRRAALYRAIVAQIVRVANRVSAERHLARVTVDASRPSGSVDLTAAVANALPRGPAPPP
jgi:hypothetical protein